MISVSSLISVVVEVFRSGLNVIEAVEEGAEVMAGEDCVVGDGERCVRVCKAGDDVDVRAEVWIVADNGACCCGAADADADDDEGVVGVDDNADVEVGGDVKQLVDDEDDCVAEWLDCCTTG